MDGKQAISKVKEIQIENKLYKHLNSVKDGLLVQLAAQLRYLKERTEVAEENDRTNEEVLTSQMYIIEDLNLQVERQSHKIKELEKSNQGAKKSNENNQVVIECLNSKLEEAKRFIDDQNFVIERLKKKTVDMKNDFDELKKALKDMYVERLERQANEFAEEREQMNQKLKRTKEFYDAEGDDLKRKILHLNEELDLLRRADFSNPSTSNKSRKRTGAGSSTSKTVKRKPKITEVKAE